MWGGRGEKAGCGSEHLVDGSIDSTNPSAGDAIFVLSEKLIIVLKSVEYGSKLLQ